MFIHGDLQVDHVFVDGDEVTGILVSMWQVFVEEEATLVEINPLCRTPDGRIVALDGKVTLDANAEFRHSDVFEAYADVVAEDDLEWADGKFQVKGAPDRAKTVPELAFSACLRVILTSARITDQ